MTPEPTAVDGPMLPLVTEVADLYCHYAWAVDDQDFPALRNLLTDDVQLTFGEWQSHGVDEMLDTYRRLLRPARAAVRHYLTNVRAAPAADGSVLTGAYFRAVFYEESGPRWQTGRYRDVMVRRPDGLRIAHKRIEIDPTRLSELPTTEGSR